MKFEVLYYTQQGSMFLRELEAPDKITAEKIAWFRATENAVRVVVRQAPTRSA